MRRPLAAAAALTMVMTLGVAPSARAQEWPVDCLFTDGGELQTVTVDLQTLQIRINEEYADDDVDAALTGLFAFLGCIESGLPTGPVDCWIAKVQEIAGSIDPGQTYFRYVYEDPATGDIVVDGGQLLADATAC